jgi:cytoskeletal protein CcmA (bactofilin family)
MLFARETRPPQTREREMFGKSKRKHENMPLAGPAAMHSAEPTLTDPTSSISRGVTVVGNIFGEGTVQVFGRVEGEVRVSTVLIKEGAQVEGDVVAEDLTIAGLVKGTIHAKRVKLDSTAIVEGDIFHRSLWIDPNARFEGWSKREDNAGDRVQHALGINAIDGVQRALDVVAALGGGSGLAGPSSTAPPAEPEGGTGENSPSPIPSPTVVPGDTEPDSARAIPEHNVRNGRRTRK